MKQDNLNKDIYSNINISDEMKESLISDVKRGKRTADFRFRYSTALMVLGIISVIGFGGFGANAAYSSYKNRLQEMSSSERTDYEEELAADTYNTGDEALTRSLTSEERVRYLKLEDEYYKNGKFPEASIKFVKKQSDISEDELAFVEEINKIHVPDGELSDEQLLQMIDHEAKYIYTIEQSNETAEESETEEGLTEESTEEFEDYSNLSFDVSKSDEESIKRQSFQLIKDLTGEELDDSWLFCVYGREWSESEQFDEEWDGFDVTISESEAPNATMYQITIPKNEGGLFMFNCCGMKYYGLAKEYTKEESEEYISRGQSASVDFIKEKFGLGDPDRVEVTDFEQSAGDGDTVATITYDLYYGENHIVVIWGIEHEMVYSVCGRGLLK